MAVDPTYGTKVYIKQGGDSLEVKSGGSIIVYSGGSLEVAGVTIDASTLAVNGLTASAAELNLNDGTTAGTVVASKTVAVDAQKAVDTLRATTDLSVGGTGVPGAATVMTTVTKAMTAFSDTVAKAVFTVTVPNAAHAAFIEVNALGVLGAGGAIGAGEAASAVKYQLAVVRTTGVATVAIVSSAIGAANADVAGGDPFTSIVVTASAMTGAVGATQTFTINVAMTRSGSGADNHTGVFAAHVLNGNATGITIA